jgi:hypothetical protein
MRINRWLAYALASFVCQILLDLWWVSPYTHGLGPLWFVAGNTFFGITWVCFSIVWVIKLIRHGKLEKAIGPELRMGRAPIIGLLASILLANVIGFLLCDLRPCSYLIDLNVAVPLAWIVGRKVLLRQIRKS